MKGSSAPLLKLKSARSPNLHGVNIKHLVVYYCPDLTVLLHLGRQLFQDHVRLIRDDRGLEAPPAEFGEAWTRHEKFTGSDGPFEKCALFETANQSMRGRHRQGSF